MKFSLPSDSLERIKRHHALPNDHVLKRMDGSPNDWVFADTNREILAYRTVMHSLKEGETLQFDNPEHLSRLGMTLAYYDKKQNFMKYSPEERLKLCELINVRDGLDNKKIDQQIDDIGKFQRGVDIAFGIVDAGKIGTVISTAVGCGGDMILSSLENSRRNGLTVEDLKTYFPDLIREDDPRLLGLSLSPDAKYYCERNRDFRKGIKNGEGPLPLENITRAKSTDILENKQFASEMLSDSMKGIELAADNADLSDPAVVEKVEKVYENISVLHQNEKQKREDFENHQKEPGSSILDKLPQVLFVASVVSELFYKIQCNANTQAQSKREIDGLKIKLGRELRQYEIDLNIDEYLRENRNISFSQIQGDMMSICFNGMYHAAIRSEARTKEYLLKLDYLRGKIKDYKERQIPQSESNINSTRNLIGSFISELDDLAISSGYLTNLQSALSIASSLPLPPPVAFALKFGTNVVSFFDAKNRGRQQAKFDETIGQIEDYQRELSGLQQRHRYLLDQVNFDENSEDQLRDQFLQDPNVAPWHKRIRIKDRFIPKQNEKFDEAETKYKNAEKKLSVFKRLPKDIPFQPERSGKYYEHEIFFNCRAILINDFKKEYGREPNVNEINEIEEVAKKMAGDHYYTKTPKLISIDDYIKEAQADYNLAESEYNIASSQSEEWKRTLHLLESTADLDNRAFVERQKKLGYLKEMTSEERTKAEEKLKDPKLTSEEKHKLEVLLAYNVRELDKTERAALDREYREKALYFHLEETYELGIREIRTAVFKNIQGAQLVVRQLQELERLGVFNYFLDSRFAKKILPEFVSNNKEIMLPITSNFFNLAESAADAAFNLHKLYYFYIEELQKLYKTLGSTWSLLTTSSGIMLIAGASASALLGVAGALGIIVAGIKIWSIYQYGPEKDPVLSLIADSHKKMVELIEKSDKHFDGRFDALENKLKKLISYSDKIFSFLIQSADKKELLKSIERVSGKIDYNSLVNHSKEVGRHVEEIKVRFCGYKPELQKETTESDIKNFLAINSIELQGSVETHWNGGGDFSELSGAGFLYLSNYSPDITGYLAVKINSLLNNQQIHIAQPNFRVFYISSRNLIQYFYEVSQIDSNMIIQNRELFLPNFEMMIEYSERLVNFVRFLSSSNEWIHQYINQIKSVAKSKSKKIDEALTKERKRLESESNSLKEKVKSKFFDDFLTYVDIKGFVGSQRFLLSELITLEHRFQNNLLLGRNFLSMPLDYECQFQKYVMGKPISKIIRTENIASDFPTAREEQQIFIIYYDVRSKEIISRKLLTEDGIDGLSIPIQQFLMQKNQIPLESVIDATLRALSQVIAVSPFKIIVFPPLFECFQRLFCFFHFRIQPNPTLLKILSRGIQLVGGMPSGRMQETSPEFIRRPVVDNTKDFLSSFVLQCDLEPSRLMMNLRCDPLPLGLLFSLTKNDSSMLYVRVNSQDDPTVWSIKVLEHVFIEDKSERHSASTTITRDCSINSIVSVYVNSSTRALSHDDLKSIFFPYHPMIDSIESLELKNFTLKKHKNKYDEILKKRREKYFIFLDKLSKAKQYEKINDTFNDTVINDGMIIRSCVEQNFLMPIIIPKAYLDSLKEVEALKRLYRFEELNFGIVTVEYKFQLDESGTRYSLDLVYRFTPTESTHSIEMDRVLLIPIASFEKEIVEYVSEYAGDGTRYWKQNNFNEFLLIALYGSPNVGGIGLPNNQSKLLNDTLFPVETEFVGIYCLLGKMKKKQFRFDFKSFTKLVNDKLKKFSEDGVLSDEIDLFVNQDVSPEYSLGYLQVGNAVLEYENRIRRDLISDEIKKKDGDLTLYDQIACPYGMLLACLRLITACDYLTLVSKLEKLNLVFPNELFLYESSDVFSFQIWLKAIVEALGKIEDEHINELLGWFLEKPSGISVMLEELLLDAKRCFSYLTNLQELPKEFISLSLPSGLTPEVVLSLGDFLEKKIELDKKKGNIEPFKYLELSAIYNCLKGLSSPNTTQLVNKVLDQDSMLPILEKTISPYAEIINIFSGQDSTQELVLRHYSQHLSKFKNTRKPLVIPFKDQASNTSESVTYSLLLLLPWRFQPKYAGLVNKNPIDYLIKKRNKRELPEQTQSFTRCVASAVNFFKGTTECSEEYLNKICRDADQEVHEDDMLIKERTPEIDAVVMSKFLKYKFHLINVTHLVAGRYQRVDRIIDENGSHATSSISDFDPSLIHIVSMDGIYIPFYEPYKLYAVSASQERLGEIRYFLDFLHKSEIEISKQETDGVETHRQQP
ncbi:MAG: hypothetical protein JSS53_05235, partial [Proteobacteria bacterium]|nr:hypothetical protein [Pseudomonadota bacterium]